MSRAVPSLNLVLAALECERQSDRTSGLEWSRELFGQPKALQELHNDDATWVRIFQAHFSCVILEKNAAAKKGDITIATSTHVNRLSAASRSLRILVERSVTCFERKTLKALAKHLLQMLNCQGKLLTPVALDYLKALRTILGHRPHCNALDAGIWIQAATLCFSIVLGAPLDGELPMWDASSSWESQSQDLDATGNSQVRRTLGIEDIEVMTCLEKLLMASNAPLFRKDVIGFRLLIQYGLFLESFPVESTAHLPALSGLNRLLRSLELNNRRALRDFAFSNWKRLVSLWNSKSKPVKEQLVICFRILLAAVTARAPLPEAPRKLVDDVAALSSNCQTVDLLFMLQMKITEDAANRFSVGSLNHSSLRFCSLPASHLPRPFQYATFTAGKYFSAPQAVSWAVAELGADLLFHIQRIQDSCGFSGFASTGDSDIGEEAVPIVDSFRGCRPSVNGKRMRSTRRMSSTITSPPVPTEARKSTRPSKRRKLSEDGSDGDALLLLMDALPLPPGTAPAKAQPRRVWLLQTLLFLFARHWRQLPPFRQQALWSTVTSLLSDIDFLVQRWAFLCLATIASSSHPEATKVEIKSMDAAALTLPWSRVWTLCCRRMSDVRVARGAALTAAVILSADLIDRHQSLLDIGNLIRDLDNTSPLSPSDSVCDFFSLAIAASSTDVSRSTLRCEERIAAWLQAHFLSFSESFHTSNMSVEGQERDVLSLLRLFKALCRLDSPTAHIDSQTVIPGTPVTYQMIHEFETRTIRSYMYDADIASTYHFSEVNHCRSSHMENLGIDVRDTELSSQAASGAINTPSLAKTANPRTDQATDRRVLTTMEQKLSTYLERCLSRIDDAHDSEQASQERTRDELKRAKCSSAGTLSRILELIVVALMFDATLLAHRVAPGHNLGHKAHALLAGLMTVVCRSDQWTMTERLTLLIALRPILVIRGMPEPPLMGISSVTRFLQTTVSPDQNSGVRSDILDRTRQLLRINTPFEVPHVSSESEIVRLLWSSASADLRNTASEQLQECIQSICGADERSLRQRDVCQGDSRESIRQAISDTSNALQSAKDFGWEADILASSLSICIHGLTLVHKDLEKTPASPMADKILSGFMLTAPLDALTIIGPTIVKMLSEGHCVFDEVALTAIVTRLGTEYLARYTYKTDEHAQVLVLDFLEAIMSQWVRPKCKESDLEARCTEFSKHFVSVLDRSKPSSWKLKVRASAFLKALIAHSASYAEWRATDDTLSTTNLTDVVNRFVGDTDARVRLGVSTSIAEIFDTIPAGTEESFYERLRAVLSLNKSDFEVMLTHLMTCANIMIRSSTLRSPAFFHLIETCMGAPFQHPWLDQARSLVCHVALKLGFDGAADMFHAFAAQITFGLVRARFDPAQLPYAVLGYRSLQKCLEHNFEVMGPMIAAIALEETGAMDSFTTLSRSMRKSKAQGITECLPALIAVELVIMVRMTPAADLDKMTLIQPLKELRTQLSGAGRSFVEEQVLDGAFRTDLDLIIVAILAQFWEQDCSTRSKFLITMNHADTAVATAFSQLSGGVRIQEVERQAQIPHRPIASGFEVYWAIRSALTAADRSQARGTSYYVIQRMVSLIWSERLVNDQIRHFQALKLYIAMYCALIRSDRILIRCLLHGTSVLMAQKDLMGHASGVAEWCLHHCLQLQKAPPDFGTTLIVMTSSIDNYHASKTSNRAANEESEYPLPSDEAFLWLEKQLMLLLHNPTTRPYAYEALCAYSRSFSEALVNALQQYGQLTISALTEAVNNNRNIACNAQLLKRFREALQDGVCSSYHQANIDVFARCTVWKLFGRLDNTASVSDHSRIAKEIAGIMSIPGMTLRFPTASQYQNIRQSPDNDANLLLLERLLKDQETPFNSIRAFIILQVLETSHSGNRRIAKRALIQLRALLTQEPNYPSLIDNWPETVLDELELASAFQSFAIPVSHGATALIDAIAVAKDFRQWICFISAYLCGKLALGHRDSFYAHLRPLLIDDSGLASKLFAPLLQSLLHEGIFQPTQMPPQLGKDTDVEQYLNSVLRYDSSDKETWRAIVRTVLYLRKQLYLDFAPALVVTDRWFGSSYGLLARRSVQCGLHSTALLFTELSEEIDEKADSAEQNNMTDLLYTIYSSVEDPDGFYGIGNTDLEGSLLRRLHHEGDWRRAFELHSSVYEAEPFKSSVIHSQMLNHSNLAQSLHKMGFNKLASDFQFGKPSPQAFMSSSFSAGYEIAWRNEDWDLPLPLQSTAGNGMTTFAALRALHREAHPDIVAATIASSLSCELSGLSNVGVENAKLARRVCQSLVGVKEVHDWSRRLVSAGGDIEQVVMQSLSWSDLSDELEFDTFEHTLAVRQSILRASVLRAQNYQMGDSMSPSVHAAVKLECALLLLLCKGARRQERQQAAMRAFTRAKALANGLFDSELRMALASEFAHVLWSQGEHGIAMEALKEAIESMQTSNLTGKMATLLADLGQWRAITRSLQPRAIDETYFGPAFQLLADGRQEQSATVCFQYATFAEEQYRSLQGSDEVKKLISFIKDREEEVRQNAEEMEKVEQQSFTHKQLSYHRHQAEKILWQDTALLRQYETMQSHFLLQAFKMYANALSRTDEHNDSVVRFTSLWFENAGNGHFNLRSSGSLVMVPAHKFLPLTHQLVSRLDRHEDKESPEFSFQNNLTVTLQRICQLHPFHSLYAVYAMKATRGDATASLGRSPASSRKHRAGSTGFSPASSTQGPTGSRSSRALAAHELWQRVKTSSVHKNRIAQLQQACDAYVQWAEFNLRVEMSHLFNGGSIRKGPYRLPQEKGKLALKTLKSMSVPVATVEVPVDMTGKYHQIVTIERYSDAFNTAGGLHLPKIVDCIGSDGKRYKQLFKSEDDLRQDAVMQQVFRLLNALLGRDRKTLERQLNVRTYIVIPLGPQCGLLEFVGNTSPIGEVLLKTYQKYSAATALLPLQARSEIAAVMGKTPQEKLKVFRQVCDRMPPLFRTYFFDRFKSPATWFTVRLNYTRSVATTSMIGHVLGLGDRHLSNILLDNVTGELVHIDFGVAFEQGKLLPIPELVPFRLTRNLIDGMGISGVEGVYRRCCEETLRVLRGNASLTKTILEVFKYDPLFVWTSNPVKMLRAQRAVEAEHDAQLLPMIAITSRSASHSIRSGSITSRGCKVIGSVPAVGLSSPGRRDTASLSAERAIQTVMRKLSSTLSVQYTVNELIQTSTDEGNLSAIFHGWQAAL